ncbi:TIGR03089 family protein [Pseudonocardia sp.]|uniref:TIGR03089 family protein n=1 Tax=Pseudonocardia sp. TaxID=60912 RepID=UPI003D0DC417
MSLTAALLDPLLAGPGAARPLVTYYDDATGERIELSAVTTANWAAKAANLLRDDCDVEPGTRVGILLPAHWQTAAVLLAAWSCGAEVAAPDGTGPAADWLLTDAANLRTALDADPAGGIVALSLDPFGKGLGDLPPGVVDFATEVRAHGDEFVPWEPVADRALALDGEPVGVVLAQARQRAAELGIGTGDRVLSTLAWDTVPGLRDGLLAVLAAGASLVQCRHPDPSRLDARAAAEKVTHRLA